MKRVAIVSPYFPPSTLAGVHRARFLSKHLPRFGWEPVVICVDGKYHEERLDEGLAALVPAETRIVRTGAFPASVCRRLGIGDLSLRAFLHIRRALFSLLETEKVDCVFITSSPYYTLLLARSLKRRFGVPVVMDFQDPWVSNWGKTLSPFTKGGLSHLLASWLEPKAVRAADRITSVSTVQNAELAARYSWLDPSIMSACPIGGDPEDFDRLRSAPPADSEAVLAPGLFNMSFVGTIMPRTAPVLRVFFAAVAMLLGEKPELASRIRLNFVGTSNQPNGYLDYRVRELAAAEGVADLVNEVPQRVPYLQALSILANSRAVLLFGSDEPHYTASKIYPAILSGTPTFSIFHESSSAVEILRSEGTGVVVAFDSLDPSGELVKKVANALSEFLSAQSPESRRPRPGSCAYSAERIVGEFAMLFDSVLPGSEARMS